MNTLAAVTNFLVDGQGTSLRLTRLVDNISYSLDGFNPIRQVIAAPSLIDQVLILCGNNQLTSVNVATGERMVLVPEDVNAAFINSIATDAYNSIYAVRTVDQGQGEAENVLSVLISNPEESQSLTWARVEGFANSFSTFDKVIDLFGNWILQATPEYQISTYLLGLDGTPFIIASEKENPSRFRVFVVLPVTNTSGGSDSSSEPQLEIVPISGTLTTPLHSFVPVAVNATTFFYREGSNKWQIWASARDIQDTTKGNFIGFDTANVFWSQRPESAGRLEQINAASELAVDQLLGLHTVNGSYSGTDILQLQPSGASVEATTLNSHRSQDGQLTASISESADGRLLQLGIHHSKYGIVYRNVIALPITVGKSLVHVNRSNDGNYIITVASFLDRSSSQYAFNPASLDGNDFAVEARQITLDAESLSPLRIEKKSYEVSDEIIALSNGSRNGLSAILNGLQLIDQPSPDQLMLLYSGKPYDLEASKTLDLTQQLSRGGLDVDGKNVTGSAAFFPQWLLSITPNAGRDLSGTTPGYNFGGQVTLKIPFNTLSGNEKKGAWKPKGIPFSAEFALGYDVNQKYATATNKPTVTSVFSAAASVALAFKKAQPSNVASLTQSDNKSISQVKKEVEEFYADLARKNEELKLAVEENSRLKDIYETNVLFMYELNKVLQGKIPEGTKNMFAQSISDVERSHTTLQAAQEAVNEKFSEKIPKLDYEQKTLKVSLSTAYKEKRAYNSLSELYNNIGSFITNDKYIKSRQVTVGVGLDFKIPIYGTDWLNVNGKLSLYIGGNFLWAYKIVSELQEPLLSVLEQQALTFELPEVFELITADGTPIKNLSEKQINSLTLDEVRWRSELSPMYILPPELVSSMEWVGDKINYANELLTTIPPLSWIIEAQQQLDSLSNRLSVESYQNHLSRTTDLLLGRSQLFSDAHNLQNTSGLTSAAQFLAQLDSSIPGESYDQVSSLLGSEFSNYTGGLDVRIKNLGLGAEARFKALYLTLDAGAYLDVSWPQLSNSGDSTGEFGCNFGFEAKFVLFSLSAKNKLKLFGWNTLPKSGAGQQLVSEDRDQTTQQIFRNNSLSTQYRNLLARENFSLDLTHTFRVINRNGLTYPEQVIIDDSFIHGKIAYGVLRLPTNDGISQSGLINDIYLIEGLLDEQTQRIDWDFSRKTFLAKGLFEKFSIVGYDANSSCPVITAHGVSQQDSELFSFALKASASSSGQISAVQAGYPARISVISNQKNQTNSASMGTEITILKTDDPWQKNQQIVFATSLPNDSLSSGSGYQQGSVIIGTIYTDQVANSIHLDTQQSKSLKLINSDPSVRNFGKSISSSDRSLYILEDTEQMNASTIGWFINDPILLYDSYSNTSSPTGEHVFDMTRVREDGNFHHLEGIFANQSSSQYVSSQIVSVWGNRQPAADPNNPFSDWNKSFRYATSYVAKDSGSSVIHTAYVAISDLIKKPGGTQTKDLVASSLTFVNLFGSDTFTGSIAADVSSPSTDTLYIASEGYVNIIRGNLKSEYPILPQPDVIRNTETYAIVDYYLDFPEFRIAAQFEVTSLDPNAPITKSNLITAILISDRPSLVNLNGKVINEFIDEIQIEPYGSGSLDRVVSIDFNPSKLSALLGPTPPISNKETGLSREVEEAAKAQYQYARIGFATNNNPLDVAVVKNSIDPTTAGLSVATNDDDNGSIVYLIFEQAIDSLVNSQGIMFLDPLLGAQNPFRQGIDGYAFSRGSKVGYASEFFEGDRSYNYIVIADPTATGDGGSNEGAIYFLRNDQAFTDYVQTKVAEGTPIVDPREYIYLDEKHGYVQWGGKENGFFGTDLEISTPMTDHGDINSYNNVVLSGTPGSPSYSGLSELMNVAPTNVYISESSSFELPLAPGEAPTLTKLLIVDNNSFLAYVVDVPAEEGLIDSRIYVRNLATGNEQTIEKHFIGRITGISDIIWSEPNLPQINIIAIDSKTGQSHQLISAFNQGSLKFEALVVDFGAYITALPTSSAVKLQGKPLSDVPQFLDLSYQREVMEGLSHNISVAINHPDAAKLLVTTLDLTAFAGKDYHEIKHEYSLLNEPFKLAIETVDQPFYTSVRSLKLVLEVLDRSGVLLASREQTLQIASNDPIVLNHIGISNSVTGQDERSEVIGISATALPGYNHDDKTSPAAFLVGDVIDNVINTVDLVATTYTKGKDYNLKGAGSQDPTLSTIKLGGNGFNQVVSIQNTIALASTDGNTSTIQFYKLPQEYSGFNQSWFDNSKPSALELNGTTITLTTFEFEGKYFYAIASPADSTVVLIDAESLPGLGTTLSVDDLPHIIAPDVSGSFGASMAFGTVNNVFSLVIGDPLANAVDSLSSEAYGGAVYVVAVKDILDNKAFEKMRITRINSYPKTITDPSSSNYLASYGPSLGASVTFANLFDKKTNTGQLVKDQQQLVIGAPMANIGSSDNIPGTVLILNVKDEDDTTSKIFLKNQLGLRDVTLDMGKFIYTDQTKQELKGTALLGAMAGSGIGYQVLNAGKFNGGIKDVLALPSPSANLYSGMITMYMGNNAVINTVNSDDSASSPIILYPQLLDRHAFAYLGTTNGATSQFSQSPRTLGQYLSPTGNYNPTFNTPDKTYPSLFASNYSIESSNAPGAFYLYGSPSLLPGDMIQSSDLGGGKGRVLSDWLSPCLPIRAGDLNYDGYADMTFYPVVLHQSPEVMEYTMPILYGENDNNLDDFENNRYTARVPYDLSLNSARGLKTPAPLTINPLALSETFQALANPGKYDSSNLVSADVLSLTASPIIKYPEPESKYDALLAGVGGNYTNYTQYDFSWSIFSKDVNGMVLSYQNDWDEFRTFTFQKGYSPYSRHSSVLAGYQTSEEDFYLLTREGVDMVSATTYSQFGIHGFKLDLNTDNQVISKSNLLDTIPGIPSAPGDPTVPDHGYLTDSFQIGTKTLITGYLISPNNSIYSFVFAYDNQTKRSTSHVIATARLDGDNADLWMSALSNRSIINSAGDFNNDGLTDLVALTGFDQSKADTHRNPFEYTVFYGDTNGNFGRRQRSIIPLSNQSAVSITSIGDTNGVGAASLVVSPLPRPEALRIESYSEDQQFSILLYPTEDNLTDNTLRLVGSSATDLISVTSNLLKESKPDVVLINSYQGSDSITMGAVADVAHKPTPEYVFISLGSEDDILNLDATWLNSLSSSSIKIHGDQGVDTLNITGTFNSTFELSSLLPHLNGIEFINLPSGTFTYNGVAWSKHPIYVNAPHGTVVKTPSILAGDQRATATFNAATFNPIGAGNLFLSSSFQHAVVDPATLSLRALSADQLEGNSGSTPFTFTIQRDGDPSVAVSVAWAVTPSGANAADVLDFAGAALPSGLTTLAAGQTSQQIILNVVGDGSFEADESFTLRLSNPVGGILLAVATTANGRIQNDDALPPPSYTFSRSADAVDEGSSLAIGVSTANVPAGSPLYWRFGGTGITASDFSDGLLEGSTVIGIDGRAAFSKAITADAAIDPDETLELRFYSDAARNQQVGSTVNVLLKQPSVGLITDGSDGITGSGAAETLIGVPTGSTLCGRGSLDRLTGGGGDDLFVLGDATGRFYDDGNPGLGSADLALISDFNAGDRIQLHGLATDYRLISGRYAGVVGLRIDALSPTPEAIGFVQGATLASLNLANSSQFLFV